MLMKFDGLIMKRLLLIVLKLPLMILMTLGMNRLKEYKQYIDYYFVQKFK